MSGRRLDRAVFHGSGLIVLPSFWPRGGAGRPHTAKTLSWFQKTINNTHTATNYQDRTHESSSSTTWCVGVHIDKSYKIYYKWVNFNALNYVIFCFQKGQHHWWWPLKATDRSFNTLMVDDGYVAFWGHRWWPWPSILTKYVGAANDIYLMLSVM